MVPGKPRHLIDLPRFEQVRSSSAVLGRETGGNIRVDGHQRREIDIRGAFAASDPTRTLNPNILFYCWLIYWMTMSLPWRSNASGRLLETRATRGWAATLTPFDGVGMLDNFAEQASEASRG
jgi:hypothetical protein